MSNKLIFSGILFFYFCISAFPQKEAIDSSVRGDLITDFYWYQKYLFPEDIPEFYTLWNILVLLQENDQEKFHRFNNDDLDKHIRELDNKVFRGIEMELEQRDKKMDTLMKLYGSDQEILAVASQHETFKKKLEEPCYPENDACFDRIDELYSRRITMPGFRPSMQAGRVVHERPNFPAQYVVQPWDPLRDCLWNIAKKPQIYGDPSKWTFIYEANKDKFAVPDNPDLIYPGMILNIPSIKGEIREGLWD